MGTIYLTLDEGALDPESIDMVMEIKLGDVVRLKKKHPCGSSEWRVERLGADIGIKCLKCQHRVLVKRGIFERSVRAFVSRG